MEDGGREGEKRVNGLRLVEGVRLGVGCKSCKRDDETDGGRDGLIGRGEGWPYLGLVRALRTHPWTVDTTL